jgi:hypothetical protein
VAMAYGYWLSDAMSFSEWGHRVPFRYFWNFYICQNMHNVNNVKHVSVGCWCNNAVKQGQIKFWNAIHNLRWRHVSFWAIFWRKPLPSSTTNGLQCGNRADNPELLVHSASEGNPLTHLTRTRVRLLHNSLTHQLQTNELHTSRG